MTPERKARNAALGPARNMLSEARRALGGTLPRELMEHPAWRKFPGDVVRTFQKRGDLARAYAMRDQDGGAAWRDALMRWGT